MKLDAKFLCGIGGCIKHHHKTLHGGTTPFVAKINSTNINDQGMSGADVLLLVQAVDTATGNVTVFYDNGSTCCLITFAAAKRLNLIGEPMIIEIKTVNGIKTLPSFAYHITLMDNEGNSYTLTVFGVANISNHRNAVDISCVKGEFSANIHNIWDLIDQPSGEIELLIGMNECGLHPTDLEIRGNLKVMSSRFGSGFLLGGSHLSLRGQPTVWNEDVSYIRLASISNNTSVVSMDANRVSLSVKPSHEFFEADIMGVEPPRRCGNCRKCKECTFIGQQCSQEEQYQYQVIESKIHYVEGENCFQVEYPFLDDPKILSENRGQVIKIAQREERKLEKEGLLQHFNEEFDKMLAYGAVVELSEEDMHIWTGAVHYVSLQHVLKEDSPSTPLRIVTNSSLSDKRGISLNSILMKGPNTLSSQWEILNRWRVYEQGMCSDLTKAYWSIRTGEVEKHVRRVVWRYGNVFEPWRTFALCVVSFGDRPAATILEIALKKIADRNTSIDPVVAQKIKDDRYVDNIMSGGTVAQVAQFVGNEKSDGHVGTLSQVLLPGSFNVKVIVTSGESNADKLRNLGRRVLGVGWDPPSDMITVDLIHNLSNAQCFQSVNYIADPLIDDLLPPTFAYTLRICLSIVNGIYDLLGLITPITIRLKVAFRDLFRLGLDLKWDDPIPREDCVRWRKLVCMLQDAKSIAFPRAVKPPNTVGKCELICYFDGSDFAYACVIYVKRTSFDGSVYTALVTSKSRVTPLLRISTPRSELNAAVLATRLVLSTLQSWAPVEIPERVWILGDSECTLSSIEKVNAAFGEYFGNRVGEILNNQAKIEEFCPVGEDGEWYHVKSSDNGADIATRLDSTPNEIGSHSGWQKGPSYLQLSRAEWPTNRDFAERKDDHIPHNELLKKYRGLIQAIKVGPSVGIDNLIDPYSTNDWNVLLHRTQNVMDVVKQLDKSKKSSVSQGRVDAKVLWFRSVTQATIEAQNQGKLKELDMQDKDGMKVVIGRAKEGLRNFFGQNFLPVCHYGINQSCAADNDGCPL